jgi:hypothetical protein
VADSSNEAALVVAVGGAVLGTAVVGCWLLAARAEATSLKAAAFAASNQQPTPFIFTLGAGS